MIDTLAGLIAYLKADTPLATLVSTRVYGAEVPEDDASSMPRKCLVVKYAGGGFLGSADYVRINEPRIDLLSYGETPHEADRVRLAAAERMKMMTKTLQGTTRLFRALHDGGPVSLRDNETNWPYAFESWMVLAGDEAVS